MCDGGALLVLNLDRITDEATVDSAHNRHFLSKFIRQQKNSVEKTKAC